ncbi:hypothetical protein DMP23_20920 [Amycolatopsis sp. A1MSW2902]|uniref:LysR family transcriptional regulator n=1 Tax=Amycolatopsis sp. A1MSW2902 TaxID=687413 RepID=UPI00307DE0F3
MELELRHLKMIDAIARSGSLSKASGEMNISQPSMTHQLAKLENFLGAPLFTRSPRGVEPTDFGRVLMRSTNYLAPLVADLSDRLRLSAPRDSGPLSRFIRMASTAGPFVAPVAVALSNVEPGQGMHLSVEDNIQELAEKLYRGQADVIVLSELSGVDCASPIKLGETQKMMIGRSEYVVLASENKRLGEVGGVSFSDLDGEEWVFSSSTPAAVRAGFLKLSGCAGSSPRVVGEMDLLMAQELVREDYGLSLIDSGFVAPSGTKKIPVFGSPFQIDHFAFWRDGVLGEQFIRELHEFASASTGRP